MAHYEMRKGQLVQVADPVPVKQGSSPSMNQGVVNGNTISNIEKQNRVVDAATIAQQKGIAEANRVSALKTPTTTNGSGGGQGTSPIDLSGYFSGGGGVSASLPSKYTENQGVIDARNALNAHNANKVADWTGGQYGSALQAAMDKILNREKFSYDLNGDALYQQYKDKYINQGKMAMADAMAQASALTGGYGNSYAATVGNQTYQNYLQSLNDVVPELYQLAYDAYNKESENLYDQYSMYNNAYNTEYGQYRDKVNDWNTAYDQLYNRYYNEANTDYSRYADDRDYQFEAYKQQVAENQYAQEMAMKQAQLQASLARNAGGSVDGSNVSDKTANTEQYNKAISDIGNGITQVTRGSRGNTGNGGYQFMGTTYKSLAEAEKALTTYLDDMKLSDQQKINILDRLGM